MSKYVPFKVSNQLIYKEIFFSLVHVFPTTILLTENKLIYKYLGLIKFSQINTKDIIDLEIINKRWVHFRLSNILFPKTLLITYRKGNKTKHTYLILSDKNIDILSKLLRRKINL